MLIDLGPRSSSTDVRAANTQRVLDVLRSNARDWMPVRVISEVSGISRPTVTRVCEALVEAGWASVTEGVSQGVGRPAREYRFHSDHRTVASALLSPRGISLQVGDLSGEVLLHSDEPCLEAPSGAEAAHSLVALLRRAPESAIAPADPAALTVAVPGLVSPDGRILSSLCAPEWEGRELFDALTELLPHTTIALSTYSRLAAEAELNHGALRGVESAVYLHPASSYDPSMIVNGAVYVGANGAAGAGGLVPVLPRLEDGRTLEDLALLAEAGDQDAGATLREMLEKSAMGIALLVSAFDPRVVVLGGALQHVVDLAAPSLAAEFARLLRYPPEIRRSTLAQEPALRGGLDRAIAALDLEHISGV